MRKLLKDDILNFLRGSYPIAYKTKELARKLDLAKQGEEYLLLKSMLRGLQEQGLIDRVEGRKWSAVVQGEVVRGTLRIAEKGFGIVTTHEDMPRELYVGPRYLAGAGHDSIVEARINPERRGRRAEAQVIRVISMPVQQTTGTIKRIKDRYFVEPDGAGMKSDIILGRTMVKGACEGDKVLVEYESELRDGYPAHGKVTEVLGPGGDHDVEMLALARRYNLDPVFPEDVEQEAASLPATIPEEEIARRLDLRSTTCFTIDPETAKDFDDAVSLENDEDGNYVLGVHIADVSWYVKEGSRLDQEARRRGTSVYLMDTVIPMFPERLSTHLCSLKEEEDRLTWSVFITITPRGAIKGYAFHRSVIRSVKRFTYQEAESVITEGKGPCVDVLRDMNSLANVLGRKRHREGSIDFDIPEVRFLFDSSGRPSDIIAVERLQSMRMIEEFMLLANKVVAMHGRGSASRSSVRPFLYRVHDEPDGEKVGELVAFLRHLGIKTMIDASSQKSFQRLLEQVENRPEKNAIHELTIRTMAKAVYSDRNIGHFGLNFQYYTHFTSPIRRYPDLVVHRLLAKYRHLGKLTPVDGLADVAQHASAMERMAMEAEREALKIRQVEYMKRFVGERYQGVISGVTTYGLYVELLPSLIEGLVHVRNMRDDYYEFDSRRKSLTGSRHGKVYTFGDSISVQVARVDATERRIDFVID